MAGQHSRRLLQRLKPSARKAALETLLLVDEGQPVQQALSQVLDCGRLDECARRQATDLAYTALRTQARCAFVVDRLLPRPEKLPPLFKTCLGLAAGAMLFEEHAPVHALVHETVEDVRALFGKGLDRVANGALRSLQRLGSAPLERDFYRLKPSDAEIDVDARFYSLPRRIVRLWRTELGSERSVLLMERSFRRPCAGIRINRAKAGWEQVRQELLEAGAERLPGDASDLPCVFFREGGTGRLGRERMATLAASGALSLQAAGSMWALHALGLFEQEAPLWDACAGFGGKTLALLEQGRQVQVASDMAVGRLRHLEGECRRLGLDAPAVFLADASMLPCREIPGDVLLDVPCSGLGVLSRRPDIRRRELNFAEFVATQAKILEQALVKARSGASVCYLTCTVDEQENAGLVRREAFAARADIVREWQTPVDSPLEGMYGAVLKVR